MESRTRDSLVLVCNKTIKNLYAHDTDYVYKLSVGVILKIKNYNYVLTTYHGVQHISELTISLNGILLSSNIHKSHFSEELDLALIFVKMKSIKQKYKTLKPKYSKFPKKSVTIISKNVSHNIEKMYGNIERIEMEKLQSFTMPKVPIIKVSSNTSHTFESPLSGSVCITNNKFVGIVCGTECEQKSRNTH